MPNRKADVMVPVRDEGVQTQTDAVSIGEGGDAFMTIFLSTGFYIFSYSFNLNSIHLVFRKQQC